MFEERFSTGVLDVPAQFWSRIDSTLFTHESDGAIAVDDDTPHLR
jgi:hypothetical protein